MKRRKAELDLTFLKNCKLLRIIPKFLCFQILYGSTNDLHAIRKRLLRNAISERLRDKRKLDSAFEIHCTEVRSRISYLEWYLLNRCLNKNVQSSSERFTKQHETKLRDLTKNEELPFTHEDTVTNLSPYTPTSAELDILKNGLKYGLGPRADSRLRTLLHHLNRSLCFCLQISRSVPVKIR